jgi:hypothetical protein
MRWWKMSDGQVRDVVMKFPWIVLLQAVMFTLRVNEKGHLQISPL